MFTPNADYLKKIIGTPVCRNQTHKSEKRLIKEKNIEVWICEECCEENDRNWKKLNGQEVINIYTDLERKKLRYGIPKKFLNSTLEGYQISNKMQENYINFAQSFIKNIQKEMGFILFGNSGTGKSHISSSILGKLIENNFSALFVHADQIFLELKDCFSLKLNAQEIKNKYYFPQILAVDEVGLRVDSTPFEIQTITDIVNSRLNDQKSTILVTNLKFKQLNTTLGFRVVNRFMREGSIMVFNWESYRKE